MSLRKIQLGLIVFIAVLVPTGRSHAGELKHPPDDYVKYRISNLRIEEEVQFGMVLRSFAFEYERTREGRGHAHVTARNERGRLSLGLTGLTKELDKKGTFRVPMSRTSQFMSESSLEDSGVEFFLTGAELMNPSGSGLQDYLVSNSITLGKISSRVSARSLTQAELQAIEREKQLRKPADSLPDAYRWVTDETLLVPGVPVKNWFRGRWLDATVIQIPNEKYVRLVRSSQKTIQYVQREKWLAISDQTLRGVLEDSDQFTSDARWLPKGRLLMEENMLPLSKETRLYPGTPLWVDAGFNDWRSAYFVDSKDDRLVITFSQPGRYSETSILLGRVAIDKSIPSELKLDSTPEKYAMNLEKLKAKLPDKEKKMKAAEQVQPGFATFPEPSSNPDTQELISLALHRKWSDSTGKFNLMASMVEKTETHVVLEKSNSQTVEVPIDRLSQSDLAYLRSQNLDYTSPMQAWGQLEDLRFAIKCCAISPDNRFLLVGGSSALLYDLASGKLLIRSERMRHLGDLAVVGFTRDGKALYLAGEKGVIDTYAISPKGKLKQAKQFPGHSKEITCLQIANDGKRVFSGDDSGTIHAWEFDTGRSLLKLNKTERQVKAIHVSADGSTLMATDTRTLFVVDSETGNTTRELDLAGSSGNAAAFSPSGAVLAVADGREIRLWNLLVFEEMEPIEVSQSVNSLKFAKDNLHFFVADRSTIEIWNAKTGTRVLVQSFGSSVSIRGMSLSQDGNLLSCPSGYDSIGILKVASSE